MFGKLIMWLAIHVVDIVDPQPCQLQLEVSSKNKVGRLCTYSIIPQAECDGQSMYL